jgi:hypothetical protein
VTKLSDHTKCSQADFPWLLRLLATLLFPSKFGTKLHPQAKVKVTLRLTVYRQSVRLGDKPLETHDQIYFSTELLQ